VAAKVFCSGSSCLLNCSSSNSYRRSKDFVDAVDAPDGADDLHVEINRRFAAAAGPLDEGQDLAGPSRAGIASSPHIDTSVLETVPAVVSLKALVAREDRLTILRRLRDYKQHLAIVVDADSPELERGELRSEVGAEPVLQLVGLDATRDARHAALLRADDERRVAAEVACGLVRTSVGRTQQELGDLRHARFAAEIQAALDLQVGRLGLVTGGDHVVENAPLNALTEWDDVGRKRHGLRFRRVVHGGISRHGSIVPFAANAAVRRNPDDESG
jgi:hypothetical protein